MHIRADAMPIIDIRGVVNYIRGCAVGAGVERNSETAHVQKLDYAREITNTV